VEYVADITPVVASLEVVRTISLEHRDAIMLAVTGPSGLAGKSLGVVVIPKTVIDLPYDQTALRQRDVKPPFLAVFDQKVFTAWEAMATVAYLVHLRMPRVLIFGCGDVVQTARPWCDLRKPAPFQLGPRGCMQRVELRAIEAP